MLKNLIHMFRTYTVTFRYLKKKEINKFILFFLFLLYYFTSIFFLYL